MPYEWLQPLAGVGAVAAVALALQLLDDAVDRRRDQALGAVNWSEPLGAAATPYAMVSLAVAALLCLEVATALFLAAYALGMAADAREPLPSGLRGWQESLAASLLAWWAWGWATALWAHALILCLQLTDDLLDAPLDRRAGELRLLLGGAHRLQTLALAAAALLGGVMLEPLLTLVGWALGGGLSWWRRPRRGGNAQR